MTRNRLLENGSLPLHVLGAFRGMRTAQTALVLALWIISCCVWAAEDGPQPSRLLPPGPAPAPLLHVVDLREADLDTRLAATTLQGLVNRGERAEVFLLLFDTDVYPTLFWLGELKRKGYIEETQRLSEEDYFDQFLERAEGLAVYDPDLPATINVATMIAGLESRMVVTPAQAKRFSDRVPDIVDLRGRWQSNAAAYGWAFKELWPKLRHDVLASYHPTHSKHHLRDYLVSQRVFTFWVTGHGHDGSPEANHLAEKRVAEEVMNAAPPNIPVIGWWDAGELDPGLTEYGGVAWAGQYGKITVPCNWQTNLSLLSGVPVDADGLTRRFRERKTAAGPAAADPGKVYVSFVIMDSGDSPTYWQHIQKRVWDDPARGTLPVGWSLSPTLLDTLPTVGEWFLDNATPQDHFFCALSGWGYCHPFRQFMAKTDNPEALWDAYFATTARHMKRLGLDQLALYTDAWRPFLRKQQDGTTERIVEATPGLRTLIMGMGRDDGITEVSPHYRIGDALASHIFTRWDPKNIGQNEENVEWLAEEIRTRTPAKRPAFMFVQALSWSYYPSDLAAVMTKLGDAYVAVAPEALVRLVAAHKVS